MDLILNLRGVEMAKTAEEMPKSRQRKRCSIMRCMLQATEILESHRLRHTFSWQDALSTYVHFERNFARFRFKLTFWRICDKFFEDLSQ
jgi:hypothetical protein